jgi:hypothetical protein
MEDFNVLALDGVEGVTYTFMAAMAFEVKGAHLRICSSPLSELPDAPSNFRLD